MGKVLKGKGHKLPLFERPPCVPSAQAGPDLEGGSSELVSDGIVHPALGAEILEQNLRHF
jgi:hypothetical protein